MGMKSGLIMAAGLALMGMTNTGTEYITRTGYNPRSKRKPYPLPDEIGIPTVIPKGHKTEAVNFEFNWQNHLLKINCTITYGTEKSKIKRISSLRGYLIEYIRVVPLINIIEYNQFKVTELEVK